GRKRVSVAQFSDVDAVLDHAPQSGELDPFAGLLVPPAAQRRPASATSFALKKLGDQVSAARGARVHRQVAIWSDDVSRRTLGNGDPLQRGGLRGACQLS